MKPQMPVRLTGVLFLATVVGFFASLALIPNTSNAQDDNAQDEIMERQERSVTIEIDKSGTVTVNGKVLGPDDDISDVLSEDQLGSLDIFVTDDGRRVVTIHGDDIVSREGHRPLFRKHRAPRAFFFDDGDDDEEGGDGEDDAVVWFGDDFMDRLQMAPFQDRVLFDGDFPLAGGMEIGGPNGFRFFSGDGVDGEVMRMEAKSRQLAQELRRAEASDKQALEAELDTLLADIFDKKQSLRQSALEDQEAHASEERSALDRRMQQRTDIIARRKAQLLGQSDW